MSDFLSAGVKNSALIFDYLFQNNIISYAFLEDGTKLKGRLVGWDDQFLLLLDGETIQLLSLKHLLRLEATTVNSGEKNIPKPEPKKPKITATTDEKVPETTEKADVTQQGNPSKDRLDQLVRNW